MYKNQKLNLKRLSKRKKIRCSRIHWSDYNVTSNNIVKSITRIKDDTKKVSEFLFKVCDICEKNINKINQDNDILKPNKIQLTAFNSKFL
jgi:hypothetical protein